MRIVFMGTPAFAVPSLMALADRHEVVAVVTRPDAVSKRGSARVPSPVREAAESRSIPVIAASSLRDQRCIEQLASLCPDAVCVVAYGALLPPEVLALPPHGCINAHASLLPRHRGAAPIERAILAGDEVTGVSIMRMDEGLDTGPVALRVAVEIGADDACALARRLSSIAADALLTVLDDVASGLATWQPQDPSKATYAAKLTRDDVRLHASLDVASALRRIRASSDRATARVVFDDSLEAVIVSARPAARRIEPGWAVSTPHGPALGFSDGSLLITAVRPAGRRTLSGAEFARGARLPESFRWEPV